MPFKAKIIATVNPYLFLSSGLWPLISGTILNIALSKIDILSTFLHFYGIGNYISINRFLKES